MTTQRFPIEEGSILLFARAVADPNPIYGDATYAATTEMGGIIAPPTFVQAGAHFDPDYPLRPRLGEAWFGSGRTPTGVPPTRSSGGGEGGGGLGSGLHAEQEFTYHRPVRPGDILSTTLRPGERWEKSGRSGKLLFSESITEYRDQTGELVVTARSVGVVTERPAGGEGR